LINKNDLKEIITKNFENIKNGELEILTFNTDNETGFLYDLKEIVESISDEKKFFNFTFHDFMESDPYYPFLNILKEYFKGKSKVEIESILKESNVYYNNYSLFLLYFLNSKSVRDEEFMFFSKEEFDFEQLKLVESILNIFIFITKTTPLIIYLSNIQYIKESSLRYIKYLLKKKKSNMLIILSYEKEIKASVDKIWKDFLSVLEKNRIIIEYKSESSNIEVFDDIKANEEQLTNGLLTYKFEECLNFYNFLATHETISYADKINNIISREKKQIDFNISYSILKILGDSYLCVTEYDLAMFYYQKMLSLAQTNYKKNQILETNLKITFVYYYQGHRNLGAKFIDSYWEEIYNKENDELLYKFYLLLFKFNISDIMDKLNFSLNYLYRFLKKINKSQYIFYFFIDHFTYDVLKQKEGKKKATQFMSKCLKLSKEFGNDNITAIIYSVYGIVYRDENDYRKALYYFKKSEELYIKIENTIRLMRLHSSIGYLSFSKEDFKRSFNYYRKAILILEEIKDYRELCNILYNIAVISLFSRNFKESLFYFENIINIFNSLNYERLYYHTRLKIYSLIGIANLKNNQTNLAYIYLNKAKEYSKIETHINEISYFELFNALISYQKKDYEKMKEYFEKAILHNGENGFQYSLLFFHYEYGCALKNINEEEKALIQFEKGLSYCEGDKYPYFRNLFVNYPDNKPLEISKKNYINLNYFINDINNTKSNTLLHSKIKEMNYLNNLQNILVTVDQRKNLIKNVFDLINNSFSYDFTGLFVKSKQNNWKFLFSQKNIDFNKNEILDYLTESKESRVIINLDKISFLTELDKKYNSIICIPINIKDEIDGCFICARETKKEILSENDLNILIISKNQVQIAYEKIKLQIIQKKQNIILQNQKDDLAKTLEDLKEAQSLLIQSEKMASLGQLIAGVAHEVNTPIGVIKASANSISDLINKDFIKIVGFIDTLSEDKKKLFFEFIETAFSLKNIYNTMELRKNKKNIREYLDKKSINNSDIITGLLAEMGFVEINEKFDTIVIDVELVNNAYKLMIVKKSIENINDATGKVSKIIYALKSYSHFENTDKKIQIDIKTGLDNVLTIYNNLIKQGIEVIRNFSEIPEIFVYPDDLNQVWTNIIQNAIHAMNNKGILTISSYKEDQFVIISIKDTGKGIPPEIKNKIFDAFFTTKSQGEGSGLGLHIVKKIIDKHNGKIELLSEIGVGTEFRIFLPIYT